MHLDTLIREKSIQVHALLREFMPLLMVCALIVCCISSPCYADGQNYLKGIKSDVSATFGKNSDLPGYLYGAETLVAGFTWMKTKSPWVFIGLPLLIIFTHWGLSYVS